MTVLLTRPEADSREIAAVLNAEGIPTLAWPLTRIEDCGQPIEIPPDTDGLVITSANGLRALARASDRRDLPVLAVGRQSAALARALGFTDVRSAEGDSVALAALAARSGLRALFHPCGAHTAGDLPQRLSANGVALTRQAVYRAVATGAPPPPAVADLLGRGEAAVLTAWSPRNARLLAKAAAPVIGDIGALTAVAISAPAAAALKPLCLPAVRIAPSPDRAGMIVAIRTAHAALR